MIQSNSDIKTITVAAGIIWKDKRFLIDQKKTGMFANYWEFPGGKCEANESPSQALVRELKEELGIEATKSSLWQILEHTYSEAKLHVFLHFFHVLHFIGEPKSKEGQSIRWVYPTEAMSLPFLAADKPILTQLSSLRLLS